MSSRWELGPATKAQIKSLIILYVGTYGFSYSLAASAANAELQLKKNFRYELNKNKVAGICTRAKVTVAPRLSPDGEALLAKYHLTQEKSAPRAPRSSAPRTSRRSDTLKRVQRFKEPAAAPDAPELRGKDPDRQAAYERRHGKSTHLSSREKRERGIMDTVVGGHLPTCKKDGLPDGVRVEDLLAMERYFIQAQASADS